MSVLSKTVKSLIPLSVKIPVRRLLDLRYGLVRAVRRQAQKIGDPVLGKQVRGLFVRIGVVSNTEQGRFTTYATKEPETLKWIDTNFTAGDTLFDIGANIGVYTLYAALRNPAGTVYAFEPEAQNFARLCRNVRLNNLANVVPCSTALSDGNGFDIFYSNSAEIGSAQHSLGGDGSIFHESPVVLRQGTMTASVDELVRTRALPEPTMIKLDVDGIEARILHGARHVLQGRSVKSLLVEISSNRSASKDTPDLVALVESWGYTLVKTSDWAVTLRDTVFQNYIFNKTPN